MLLIAEKGIKGRICSCVYRYAEAKYMKYYDPNKKSSYLIYWDDFTYFIIYLIYCLILSGLKNIFF